MPSVFKLWGNTVVMNHSFLGKSKELAQYLLKIYFVNIFSIFYAIGSWLHWQADHLPSQPSNRWGSWQAEEPWWPQGVGFGQGKGGPYPTVQGIQPVRSRLRHRRVFRRPLSIQQRIHRCRHIKSGQYLFSVYPALILEHYLLMISMHLMGNDLTWIMYSKTGKPNIR